MVIKRFSVFAHVISTVWRCCHVAIRKEMKIRKAKSNESEILTQIAQAAKRYWNYPERWLILWKDALTITPDFILKNEV